MGERGWEYRRRRPEGTVLYAEVRDNLATLLAQFAPGSKLRPFLFPQAGEEGASVAPEAADRKEPKKERMPRVESRVAAAQEVRVGRLDLCLVWRQAPGVDGT